MFSLICALILSNVFSPGAICIGAVFGVYVFVAWFIAVWLMYLSIDRETTSLTAKEQWTEDETVRVNALAGMWKEWHYNIFHADPVAAQRGRDLCASYGVNLTSPDVLSTTSRTLKATILFQTIDLDGTGELSVEEMECFLARFGVVNPSAAAKVLLCGKKRVCLSDFTEHLAAFYEYAFSSLAYLETEHEPPSVRRKLLALAARQENTQAFARKTLNILDVLPQASKDGCSVLEDGNAVVADAIIDTSACSAAPSPVSV